MRIEDLQSEHGESDAVVALKRELFARDVPEEYRDLMRTAQFFQSPQPYADRLMNATSAVSPYELTPWQSEERKSSAAITEGVSDVHLTEFGRTLQGAVRGREFIDLANGGPEGSPIPRIIARAFGAQRYIGVDEELRTEEIRVEADGFKAAFLRGDVLEFLAQLSPRTGVIVHVSGFEPVYSYDPKQYEEVMRRGLSREVSVARATVAYIDACLRELQRILKPGDVLLIGDGMHGWEPEPYGFIRHAEEKQNVLYLRQ